MQELGGFIREQSTAIVAAVAGAFISLPFARERKPFTVVVAVFSGVGSAYYLTPATAALLRLDMGAYGAVAFIFGLTGMTAISAGLRALDDPVGSLARLIQAWRGK